MKIIPVHIISGFLGAGKTTAILRLIELKNPKEKWAIVVNEFGKISIDGQTLQSRSMAGSVYNIAGGCICCSARGYLNENLVKIIETGLFDRIIIEPSGLGGIEMITEITASMPALERMPVICMVDITTLENHKLQRNLIYRSQIEKADRIVFSKFDLYNDSEKGEELVARFNTIFPGKKISLTNLYLNPQFLLEQSAETSEITANIKGFYPVNQLDDSNYKEHCFSWSAEKIFDWMAFQAFVSTIPDIIRAKGHVRTLEGWHLLNHSYSALSITPCQEKAGNELVIIAQANAISPTELTSMVNSFCYYTENRL